MQIDHWLPAAGIFVSLYARHSSYCIWISTSLDAAIYFCSTDAAPAIVCCGPCIHAAVHRKMQVFTVCFHHVGHHLHGSHPEFILKACTLKMFVFMHIVKLDCTHLHLEVPCCMYTWTC